MRGVAWTAEEEKAVIRAISKAKTTNEAVELARQAAPKRPLNANSLGLKLSRMGITLGHILHKNASKVKQAPLPIHEDVGQFRKQQLIEGLKATNIRLMRELEAKDAELENFKAITREPKPVIGLKKKSDTQRKGCVVLQCSDWHVGETVDPESVNGLNEYNTDIAAKCIDRLAEGFEWMNRDKRFDIRTAIIHLGGDLMTGYIHPELQELNSMSPQEEQLFLLDKCELFLRRIAKDNESLERILVMCNSGNHGRATDKQRVSSRESNSHEQVVYQTLHRLLKNDSRFEFHIARGEWIECNAFGFRMAFTHGDSFNYQGGIGGITIPIRRGIDRQFKNRKIHQFCMGHFHSRQDLGDVQINGSMIGYSAYSQRIHAPFEPRQQNWFLVDSERGKCLSAPIWL